MRVGRDAVAALGLLLPEPVQLLLGEPALQERPGVHARGGVTLEEDLVPAAGMVGAAEEVVEADLVEGGRAGVGGDVTAHADLGALGPVHHHGGVPAQPAAVGALDLLVARELRLLVHGDRVHVVRGDRRRGRARGPGSWCRRLQEVLRPLPHLLLDEVLEGTQPLRGCGRCAVRGLGGRPVAVFNHVLRGHVNSFSGVMGGESQGWRRGASDRPPAAPGSPAPQKTGGGSPAGQCADEPLEPSWGLQTLVSMISPAAVMTGTSLPSQSTSLPFLTVSPSWRWPCRCSMLS